jgi:phosphatidylglycerophosphate synthase
MLGHYKAPLHRFFDPVARLLFRARVRPNHLTVLGLGVSIAAAYVFSVGRLRWGAALLAVAGLFDFFDGAVARLAGSDSDYGAFLDSVVDRYSDLAVLLGMLSSRAPGVAVVSIDHRFGAARISSLINHL